MALNRKPLTLNLWTLTLLNPDTLIPLSPKKPLNRKSVYPETLIPTRLNIYTLKPPRAETPHPYQLKPEDLKP